MLGDFTYHNPCRVHFGPNALDELPGELAEYGPKVLLTYGGGSIKRNGVYDKVIAALEAAGKTVFEVPGVMSNPTADKLREGAKVARENDVDLILAVGGDSTIDYAKGVSVSAWTEGDPWEHLYLHMEEPTGKVIPVGDVLTMSGTGSEMNAGSVITNHEEGLKIGHVFGSNVIPRFAIVNPELTFTVPDYQMRAGIYDAFNHICEQYFSGTDDNTSDYIAEGLMRSLVHASRIAVKDPNDYEARSNISWVCTWALNTLIACGKSTDWEVHMLGQAIGAVTNATHGMTLSAVSLPYYRLVMPYGVEKFALCPCGVERGRLRQVRARGRRGGPGGNERVDGPDWRGQECPRAGTDRGEHPRCREGDLHPERRLPQADDRGGRADLPREPVKPRRADGMRWAGTVG